MHIVRKITCIKAKDILTTKTLQGAVLFAFPDVETILRLFLSLAVTDCSGERSFSRLKHVKNELQTSILQDKASAVYIK
jgi:hypothetical protein